MIAVHYVLFILIGVFVAAAFKRRGTGIQRGLLAYVIGLLAVAIAGVLAFFIDEWFVSELYRDRVDLIGNMAVAAFLCGLFAPAFGLLIAKYA